MASTGKKGKKGKGTVLTLQSFLADDDVPAGTTQVAKKVRNIDGEESDDGNNALPLVYQLPTAPRANRIFSDESIPHKPPFIAYVTNLPFDVNEDDIYAFFGDFHIVSLRLPREDGETGRVRGFGYVEFGNRDDLLQSLSLPDPSVKGRRIRIEISNESELHGNKQKTNRRGFEGFRSNNDGRESTNWRQDSVGTGNCYDKGQIRERKTLEDNVDEPGSWRMGVRLQVKDFSPKRDQSNGRRSEFGTQNRNFERNDREKLSSGDEALLERPKLNLKPRTLPLPEIVTIFDEKKNNFEEKLDSQKTSGVSAEKVFGSAKPVDTAAREMEIEERLEEARRQERFRKEGELIDASEKLSSLQLEKTEKENTNSTISWRHRNTADINTKIEIEKYCPDMKNNNRDKNPNRYSKNRDKNERTDKPKREIKSERVITKNQQEAVLQSSNKYFELDDGSSE